MLGPIILSSKTEILALKELVILLIKMFKHREKGNKKIELSTLHCKLTRKTLLCVVYTHYFKSLSLFQFSFPKSVIFFSQVSSITSGKPAQKKVWQLIA